ncbi:hypothetical protein FH972_023706 [Carpinus fangiana]|uniref:Transcription factor domain-containing protein n=1 Tax=Carpinus fangiana TaxID=176857 RepID=A0A5N6KYF2_9ROSI|nr:hypothetical protein FH972_023706 [Carpinus fangiana]
MDASTFHPGHFSTYGYLDGRPVVFTADGYPIEYHPLQVPQMAYHAIQDSQVHEIHAGCRKGSRDCVYPPANEEGRTKSRSKAKSHASRDTRSLEADPPSELSLSPAETSTLPDNPLSRTNTQSPLDGQASPDDTYDFTHNGGTGRSPKFYLDYLSTAISHHHYGLSHPSPELIPTYLVSASFHFKPLLHAVVAFSAYNHAVRVNEASLQDFIFHYAESVSLLREYLSRWNKPRNVCQVSILLTILQLATIEEFLGDWTNLINHQKAAAKVIFELYTPNSIFEPEDEVPVSKIFSWYYHFDLFVSYIGGTGTTIGREWFEAQQKHALMQVEQDPENLDHILSERHAVLRIVGCDCSVYFKELKSGVLSPRAIKDGAADLMQRLDGILDDADPAIIDRSKICVHVQDTSIFPQSTDNPWDPIEYYAGPLWSVNYLNLRIWGLKLMMLNHMRRDDGPPSPNAEKRPSLSPQSSHSSDSSTPPRPNPQIVHYALRMLRLFSAIQTHDPDPGATIGAQAGLTFASIFIGRCPPQALTPPSFDVAKAKAHSHWCRLRLREVELLGYIVPTGMRTHMGAAWNEDVSIDESEGDRSRAKGKGWWFPDEEGLTPVIRAVRDFCAFRTRAPEDVLGEDMREMNGLFAKMAVGEGSGTVSLEDSGEEDNE